MLIELYSEILLLSKLVIGYFHSGGDYCVVWLDGVGSWYLFYTVFGMGWYLLGDNKLTLRYGDVVLVSFGMLYDYGIVGMYWESWWAHF